MKMILIRVLAWIQVVVSSLQVAVSPCWLLVDLDLGKRQALVLASAVLGIMLLVDAVHDLMRAGCTDKDDEVEKYFTVDLAGESLEVFCNADVIQVPGSKNKLYICFPDGLRLIVEDGRYNGWYTVDHQVV